MVEPLIPSRLTVKFLDGLKVRASNGSVISLVNADLSTVVAVRYQYSLTFAPSTYVPQTTLDFIESRAAQMSGIAQPDLGGILEVSGPAESLEDAGNALLALGDTEFVEFSQLNPDPPCVDLYGPTPQLFPQNATYVPYPYHFANPGMNMFCAWAYGGRGDGVQVTDCEYGFRWTPMESDPIHEDICDIETTDSVACLHVGGNPLSIRHGLATLGVLGALDNGYGWTGLVPDAHLRFESEYHNTLLGCTRNRNTAIDAAIAASQPGDVILLEMQTNFRGAGYVPAEVDNQVWLRSRAAWESGIIVVAPAGNGGVSLNLPWYAAYLAHNSFAIIVGAGTSDLNHDRMPFSTYGLRVNVQGAGEHVYTIGYGANTCGGPFDDFYQSYDCHTGTSSAAAKVAGAAASIQSMLACRGLPKLTPTQLRQVLIDTGIDQGDAALGQHIGAFPDLGKAILQLGIGAMDINANDIPDCCDGSASTATQACCIEDGTTCVVTTACGCAQMCGTLAPTATCKVWSCGTTNGPQGEP